MILTLNNTFYFKNKIANKEKCLLFYGAVSERFLDEGFIEVDSFDFDDLSGFETVVTLDHVGGENDGNLIDGDVIFG